MPSTLTASGSGPIRLRPIATATNSQLSQIQPGSTGTISRPTELHHVASGTLNTASKSMSQSNAYGAPLFSQTFTKEASDTSQNISSAQGTAYSKEFTSPTAEGLRQGGFYEKSGVAYNSRSPYINSSDSAVETLVASVSGLVSSHSSTDVCLGKCAVASDELAKIFSGVNPSLVQSWNNVADTFTESNSILTNDITEFMDMISSFAKATSINEEELLNISRSVSEASTNFLNQLRNKN